MKERIKKYHFLFYFLICVGLIFSRNIHAMEMDFIGQLSGWTMETRNQDAWKNNTGLRYIPQLTLSQTMNEDSFFDAEASLNGFLTTGSDESSNKCKLELYRAKLRYATAQTETRIGLQKIDFGPARLLRPLMWFDRVNPTDPLQLTEGVYALRFKYNALNNANFWLWGLYGNDDPKGYETLPTASDSLESGGRLQYPVPRGELAATFHYREVEGSRLNVPDFNEKRYALDGQWDIGIGLWFESVFQQQKVDVIPYDWTKLITIGIDYTFGIGNGLYVLFEHMATVFSSEPFGGDEDAHISAFSFNYPIGIIDKLTAIGYYSWDHNQYYQYLSWQRAYDTVVFDLSVFYYPEVDEDNAGFYQSTATGGYGVRLMIIFNH